MNEGSFIVQHNYPMQDITSLMLLLQKIIEGIVPQPNPPANQRGNKEENQR